MPVCLYARVHSQNTRSSVRHPAKLGATRRDLCCVLRCTKHVATQRFVQSASHHNDLYFCSYPLPLHTNCIPTPVTYTSDTFACETQCVYCKSIPTPVTHISHTDMRYTHIFLLISASIYAPENSQIAKHTPVTHISKTHTRNTHVC